VTRVHWFNSQQRGIGLTAEEGGATGLNSIGGTPDVATRLQQ